MIASGIHPPPTPRTGAGGRRSMGHSCEICNIAEQTHSPRIQEDESPPANPAKSTILPSKRPRTSDCATTTDELTR